MFIGFDLLELSFDQVDKPIAIELTLLIGVLEIQVCFDDLAELSLLSSGQVKLIYFETADCF